VQQPGTIPIQETGKELEISTFPFSFFYIANSRKKLREGNGIVHMIIKPTHYTQICSKTGKCTYTVTLRRVRATIVAVDKQNGLHIPSVRLET
jgi:hypothetical protein